MKRRDFLRLGTGTGLLLAAGQLRAGQGPAIGIDRRAVVRRHNPDFRAFDPFGALSLGNGEFAFTADITGLQTFADQSAADFPLCTMSHWGWHSFPQPPETVGTTLRLEEFDTFGRPVGYMTSQQGQAALFNWLRENPHRLHLGRLALEFGPEGAPPIEPSALTDCRQQLDLWTGQLDSRMTWDGQPVVVRTAVHPGHDLLAVRIESPLVSANRLRARLAFPYGSPAFAAADWTQPGRHETTLIRTSPRRATLARTLDADTYVVEVALAEGALAERAPHEFVIETGGAGAGDALEFVCLFAPAAVSGDLPGFAATRAAAAAHWEEYWSEGGFVDLGDCTDPRAPELERRTVLSLYQSPIHSAGSLPSAETGLLFNSWYGKFHLEMHWWHSVHFDDWNRFPLFERTLAYYPAILESARDRARQQGYRGARWPKMTDETGRDSPSSIGTLLIWQQPHPIDYAERVYRRRPTRETLEAWRDVVFDTAEFMADFAHLDAATGRYVLGPPIKTVSENTDALSAHNPTFELAYWRAGLRVAQAWRRRLGLAPDPKWADVLARLAPLPVADGRYLLEEGMTDTYTEWNWEHPAQLGALGVQPGDGVDVETMRRTLQRTVEVWQWDRCWGWDFPMAALCAARLGEGELAVRALSIDSPKNRFHPNGHNYQREELTSYLPGNGGLLAAIAAMVGPGDAGPTAGFPADGRWRVRREGLG